MPAPDAGERSRLEAEARYHRDRLALYRARMMRSATSTSLSRLRELERISRAADERARAAASAAG
jgi:hypothetical protein